MNGNLCYPSFKGRIFWRRKWQPTPIFLPGKVRGQRSLVGYSPGDHKESEMTKHIHTAKERDAKDEAIMWEQERSDKP